MGYQQEVVERVVKATGQTEDTFLLLEKIVQETKRCEEECKKVGKETNLNSASSSTSTVSHLMEKERNLSRIFMEPGRTKEKHASKSNGLGHRRQCSSSETRTQQVITIRRSSSAQGGTGNQEVIAVDDDNDEDDVLIMDTKTADSRTDRALTVPHLDTQSGSRTDFLARGGGSVSQRDYLTRGGTQTLGGSVKVENVTALRSTPQWLTGPTSSLALTPSSAQPITRPSPSPYQTISHMSFHGAVARTPPANDPPAPPVTGLARFHQSLKTRYILKLLDEPGPPDLRHVIIDGSNVAMAHGLKRFFSCRGIALAVETFWKRGHREITVFVPQWRQKKDRVTTERHFLEQLENLGLLSFTPSREVCGQRISSHDDRFMLHLAEITDGIIVTNDNLRDFVNTKETWQKIIKERLLQFTFVEDHFMIPDDPLGRHGPHLDIFLQKRNRSPGTPPPLRPADIRLSSQQQQPTYAQALHTTNRTPSSLMPHPAAHWSHTGGPEWHAPRRSPSPSPSPPPQRSTGETSELKKKLYDIFPDQKQRIDRILTDNPYMRDLNALSGLLLG